MGEDRKEVKSGLACWMEMTLQGQWPGVQYGRKLGLFGK